MVVVVTNCPLWLLYDLTELSCIHGSITQKYHVCVKPSLCIPSHFQQIYNGLNNSSRAYWTVWLTHCKNNLKHISAQKIATFSSFFLLPCDKNNPHFREAWIAIFTRCGNDIFQVLLTGAFSALTLLVWRQEGHPACKQEAQLSPRDCAMRRVNWNLASCHATVQKLLIRHVLTKSMVWSWRFSRRQCVIDNVHSTMTRSSRLPLSQVQ